MNDNPNRQFLIDGFPRNKNNLDGWCNLMTDKACVKGVLFFDCTEEVRSLLLFYQVFFCLSMNPTHQTVSDLKRFAVANLLKYFTKIFLNVFKNMLDFDNNFYFFVAVGLYQKNHGAW